MILVVGTGSGKKENLTFEAFNAIKNAKTLVLKTEKMPVLDFIKEEKIPYTTLDFIYEEASDFDELNNKIKEHLSSLSEPVYLVHGSGLDDTSVRILEDKKIIPGVSLNDCALAFLNLSTDAKHYTSFEILNGVLPSSHVDNIITCIDSSLLASDIKCILTEIFGDEYPVSFYYEDFSVNQSKKDILLYELDMQENYNHTASIFIKKPEFDGVYKYDCQHLVEVMERLCSKNGCTWDQEQTHTSLTPYLIEEAYEVANAINKDDIYSLYDELGDVLLQVVFHACIGKKCGEFDFFDITDAITKKMINRHPQIFKNEEIIGSLNDHWEKMKKEEKGFISTYEVLKDEPENMASLMRAQKVLKKAEKAGLKLKEPIHNIIDILNKKGSFTEEEIGDILLFTVALAKENDIVCELALHKKTEDFIEKEAKTQ